MTWCLGLNLEFWMNPWRWVSQDASVSKSNIPNISGRQDMWNIIRYGFWVEKGKKWYPISSYLKCTTEWMDDCTFLQKALCVHDLVSCISHLVLFVYWVAIGLWRNAHIDCFAWIENLVISWPILWENNYLCVDVTFTSVIFLLILIFFPF